MSSTSLQYQLPEKGGKFEAVRVPYPIPTNGEVCIRTKAIALNPVDWKRHLSGMLVESWPVVLGMDAAGVVESVGEGVEGLSVGDEVFCLVGRSNRAAAFQEVIASPAFTVARKPDFLSFEEAASVPLCFVTAAAYIVFGLHVSLPFVQAPASTSLKSVLVLGGSSAVGGAAIQLLRMALPHATILTTSSAKHYESLTSLGATKCFDRSVSVDELKAATEGSSGVDGILDAVGGAADQPFVFEVLSTDGPRLYAQVLTGKSVQVPSDVNSEAEIAARQLFTLPGGMMVIKTLADLLHTKQYKPPLKIEVIGSGLDSIAEGLEVLKKGVSGTKCVIKLP